MDHEALMKRLERAQRRKGNMHRDILAGSAQMSEAALRKHVEAAETAAEEADGK